MKISEMAMGDKENTAKGVVFEKSGEQKPTCRDVLNVGNPTAGFGLPTEDEGGGAGLKRTPDMNEENIRAFLTRGDSFENNFNAYNAYGYDIGDEAAAVDFLSNRTSRNNSTDNLSYASDQFYSKDLIFLEDDYDDDDNDDNGAEVDDKSLNSDDCVYAYRGDGADIDFDLETIAGRRVLGVAGNSMDDEMDFLEMDFDPDTLSEIENGGISIESDAATATASAAVTETLLLPRTMRNGESGQQQRQHFSSPTDDLSSGPMKALQTQTLLGKNFGCMSLHLDQIQCGVENASSKPLGCEPSFERTNGLDAVVVSSSVGANLKVDLVDLPTTAAHSLPNTLHTFVRQPETIVNHQTSPSKVTGAKPKRLSTFSTSSSTSSKNSCKSRTSLRSVIGPSLYNSSSFDERSVSCTEFRSVPTVADENATLAGSANGLANNQFDFNDESSCLDCLEKEFLASTIGRALDPINCPKCRRKRFGFSKSEQQQQNHQSLRCRSGSPSFFSDIANNSFYELPNEAWVGSELGRCIDIGSFSLPTNKQKDRDKPIDSCMPKEKAKAADMTAVKCDIISGEQLLKNLLTDKEVVTISTTDVSEDSLVRALDQLQISYNVDLLKFYFERLRHIILTSNLNNNTKANLSTVCRDFIDLKEFLIYESKKNCNYPKLMHLIEVVTQQQIEIQFQKDTNKIEQEYVNISAADILRQWNRNNDILNLQELDERFKKSNVLGKIANLIRQTQTKRTSMRTQIEYIAIPQYYPSGYLILKKLSQAQ